MDNIEYVVKNSDNVKVNENNIASIIDTIENAHYKHWSQKDEFFKKLNEKELIIFAFILESMNFCFWPNYDWKITYKSKEYFGSDTLLFTLLNAVTKGIIKLNIKDLYNLSKDDFYSFMKSNNQYPILMEERYNSFKETINTIYNNKNFWNELFSIQSDLNLEKYIVENFNNFKDVSNYKGKSIAFNKRCRLVIADLFFISKIIHNNIKNINNIMGCADYSLPRYFREIGIFEYSYELTKMIDEEIELEHNSNCEIEIRAATLYVLEIIKKELGKKNIIVSSIELDNKLWYISRAKRTTKPHHTISIYY